MVFLERDFDVLAHGQRGKQGAILEQHAGPALHGGACLRITVEIAAEHLDAAGLLCAQAENGPHQHRFTGAGAADHAENLAVADIEVEVLMDHLSSEGIAEIAHGDRHFGIRGCGRDRVHQPISMKNTAARASITITSEMLWTTAEVVRSPTDWAVPATLNPSRQPTRAITIAKIGALLRPTR